MKFGGLRVSYLAQQLFLLGSPDVEPLRRVNVNSIVDGFIKSCLVQYLKKLFTALEYSAVYIIKDRIVFLPSQCDIQEPDVFTDERAAKLECR